MGKRSDFPRLPQGKYDTPFEAARPLMPHLAPDTRFIEPCAGNGYLVGHLKRAGHVLVGAFDLPTDARSHRYDVAGADAFITNPDWDAKVMHPLIVNLSDKRPTWLLIYADWVHTRQSIPYLPRLRTIVSIGRVKWIPDSPFTGKDNAVWCLFDRPRLDGSIAIQFIGRVDSTRAKFIRRAA